MEDTQSDDAAQALFRSLRNSDHGDGVAGDGDEYGEHSPSDADVESGGDLVNDLKLQADALIEEADKLALTWLEEAEKVREEAYDRRQQAESELIAARIQVQSERDALLEEARAQILQEGDVLRQEAENDAAGIRQRTTEEVREQARAEAEGLLQEAQQTALDLMEQAKAEADRIVGEARREESRILLDARARVDDVRSRLVRLYQEMESASVARWAEATGMGSPGALDAGGSIGLDSAPAVGMGLR